MNKLLMICALLFIVSCSREGDQSLDKLVKVCWAKYEHDESGLMNDPKCSNMAVITRLMDVDLNRRCGYPDLYNGKRNLDDLSNLTKKEQQYTQLVLSCTEQYLKYAEPDRLVPNGYEYSSLKTVLHHLAKDQKCNIPAVKSRLDLIMMGKRGKWKGDEGVCRE